MTSHHETFASPLYARVTSTAWTGSAGMYICICICKRANRKCIHFITVSLHTLVLDRCISASCKTVARAANSGAARMYICMHLQCCRGRRTADEDLLRCRLCGRRQRPLRQLQCGKDHETKRPGVLSDWRSIFPCRGSYYCRSTRGMRRLTLLHKAYACVMAMPCRPCAEHVYL